MTSHENLEEKLKQKLESGEIDQKEYDNLMKKFGDLDLLGTSVRSKKSYSYSGSKTMEGGQISEPVKVSGRLHVTDSLTCPRFSVSGSATVDGSLTVTGPTRISGSLNIEDDGKFGETLKLSGKLTSKNSIFLTQGGKVSGKLMIGERLVSDNKLSVSGKLEATSVQSTSSINISGGINLVEGLVAEEFTSSGGPGTIGGSLQAKRVEVAKKYRLNTEDSYEDMKTENLESIPELGKFISNMVTKFIPKVISNVVGSGSMSVPKILKVEGDIKGEDLDLSYCVVKGDIIGTNVIIGPEVTVEGRIKYQQSITLPDDNQYNIEKFE